MTETKVWVALIAVAIIAAGAYFFPAAREATFGAVGTWSNFYGVSSAQSRTGSGCDDGFTTCAGTTVSGFNFGSCQVQASSNTIAASSTATVDCVLAAGASPGTALTGITIGDNVSVSTSTTSPTTFEGLAVRGASASSTAGYITMNLYNGTGTTFTWTSAASSSFVYRAWR